jgi:hypothetical protein
MFNLFFACKEQKKCDELYKFLFVNTGQENIFNETYLMGKDIIPCLIDFIDINKKTFIGFQDPKSSNIYPFISDNYIGIRAAYLIEFVLSKDTITTSKSDLWEQEIEPYRIYKYGVIVNTQNKEPIPKSLNSEDIKVLKEIYLKWWQSNKEKPLEQLRKEWKENKHILDNSSYKWI